MLKENPICSVQYMEFSFLNAKKVIQSSNFIFAIKRKKPWKQEIQQLKVQKL